MILAVCNSKGGVFKTGTAPINNASAPQSLRQNRHNTPNSFE